MLTHNEQQNYQDLIIIFNRIFKLTQQTILVHGGAEPIYLPKDRMCPLNQIIFKDDFYASALHEVAHWCLAGIQRRKLIDYGYWYKQDGRNSNEQRAFEQVEVKPQALEWIFSEAAGVRFNISADNLNGESQDGSEFKLNVYHQAISFLNTGLPERAELFKAGLLQFYNRSLSKMTFR